MIERVNSVSTVGQRYRLLNVLGAGGMGIVYRAIDRLTGQVIALKRISFRRDKYISDLQAALAEEFRALSSMRHPHIIRVLDYGFDNHEQSFFTMELLEGALTIKQAGQGQPFSLKVSFVQQLLQGLVYLHRRGVVHRDLKPGNVLVYGNQVKLLDFGFSLADKFGGKIAGTPHYLAPEVLAGRPGDLRADLYAVGAIGYELFFERNLSDLSEAQNLNELVLEDSSQIETLEVDRPLRRFLSRLLARKPEARYASAEEAIQALFDAVRQPVPSESISIRESYLQSARFVGRSAELSHLISLLLSAAGKHGSCWLIGGESGVGKSRLLDEFCTLALIHNAVVLRGQVNNYQKSSHQLWREPLRHLVLSTDITDQEAVVLKTVVRDLETLLERPVPEMTGPDRSATHPQLASTIAGIIDRSQKATVLILEDLHRANSEDVALLNEINTHIQDLPLLILVSYRSDEHPDFPSRLNFAQIIPLNRLQDQEIATLSALLLGPEGERTDLVEMLQRESEGNVYFLIEIVRSLKESADSAPTDGTKSLLPELYTGGVRQIIERRLNRIPDIARPLLYVAALGENRIDPTVLRSIARTIDFDEWVAICVEAAVLTFQDDSWQFSHGQLKQTLLKELSPEQQQHIHAEIALALETVYPDLTAFEVELAYHWGKAGNNTKELQYSLLAGEHALNRGDYEAALTFLTRALELETALGLPDSRVKQAALKRMIANVYYVSGDLAHSRNLLEQALSLLHFEIPRTKIRLLIGLLFEGVVQVLHRIMPIPLREPSEASWQASRAYDQLGHISYLNDSGFVLLYSSLRQTNLAEIDGASDLRARAYASLSVALSASPFARFAEHYSREAKNVAVETGDYRVLSWVLQLIGLREASRGQWREAGDDLRQASEYAQKASDEVRWQECAILLTLVMTYQGSLAQAGHLGRATSNLVISGTRSVNRIWILLTEAEVALMRGRVDDVLTLLEKAASHIEDSTPSFQKLRLHALRALAYLYMGIQDLARQQAENALAMIRGTQLAPTIYMLPALTILAEVSLTLSQRDDLRLEDSVQMLEAVRQSCAYLLSLSRSCPIGQPAYWLMQGWAEWLLGKRIAAERAWHLSLSLSEGFGMPYMQALAHFKLGKHLQENAVWHLQQAVNIFTQLESLYYLAQATMALREQQASA